jgi:hypothetical protein
MKEAVKAKGARTREAGDGDMAQACKLGSSTWLQESTRQENKDARSQAEPAQEKQAALEVPRHKWRHPKEYFRRRAYIDMKSIACVELGESAGAAGSKV